MHRPGNNLFAESLVCVDLKTGKRKWHFQVVHHPIWDYDLSSAPILADINVGGKAIKAVALPSKEAAATVAEFMRSGDDIGMCHPCFERRINRMRPWWSGTTTLTAGTMLLAVGAAGSSR